MDVERAEDAHEVGRDGDLRREFAEDGALVEVGAEEGFGVETTPVDAVGGDGLFAVCEGRFDLRPVVVGAAPDGGGPVCVECIQRSMTGPEPVAEGGGAARAVAVGRTVAAVFVADMPEF